MKKTIIFHHNDMDGRAAGAAIAYLTNNYDPSCYRSAIYKPPLDISGINEGDTVYFVDYSFNEKTKVYLDTLLEMKCYIIWIDHHQTSIDLIEKYPEYGKIKGIRDTSRCGAYLTWEWLYNKGHRKIYYEDGEFDIISDKVPRVLEIVDDYDRWIHQYEETHYFNNGLRMYDQAPTSKIWQTLFHYDFMISELDLMKNIIKTGKIINEYNKMEYEKYLHNNGYETMFEGHKVLALCRKGNSDIFGEKFHEYPFVISYGFDGDGYNVTLYSSGNRFNCKEIAEKYGGGGHPGAAGFRIEGTDCPFIKIKE